MTEVTLAGWDAGVLLWAALPFGAFLLLGIIGAIHEKEDGFVGAGLLVGFLAGGLTALIIATPAATFKTEQRVNALTESGYTMVEVEGDDFFAAGPDGQAVRGTFAHTQGDQWLIVEFK